jgi:hypothetical protein
MELLLDDEIGMSAASTIAAIDAVLRTFYTFVNALL